MRELVVDLRRVARKSATDRAPTPPQPARRSRAWIPWLAVLAHDARTRRHADRSTRARRWPYRGERVRDPAAGRHGIRGQPSSFECRLIARRPAACIRRRRDGRYTAHLDSSARVRNGQAAGRYRRGERPLLVSRWTFARVFRPRPTAPNRYQRRLRAGSRRGRLRARWRLESNRRDRIRASVAAARHSASRRAGAARRLSVRHR